MNPAPVMIDIITGQLAAAVSSSARYKQDIAAIGARSDGLLKLRPVTFTYKEDTSGTLRYGLIAEEVAAVYSELVTRTATGEIQSVKYHELIPMLLNELQRQQQTLQQQASALSQLSAIQKELAELRTLVGSRQGQ